MEGPHRGRPLRTPRAFALLGACLLVGSLPILIDPGPSTPACAAASCGWSCAEQRCAWENPFLGDWLQYPCPQGYTLTTHVNVSTPVPSTGRVQLGVDTSCFADATAWGTLEVWAGLNSPTFSAWKPTGVAYNVTAVWSIRGSLEAWTTCAPGTAPSGPAAAVRSALFLTLDTFDFTAGTNPDTYQQQNVSAAGASCGGGATALAPQSVPPLVTIRSTDHFAFVQGDVVSVSAAVGLELSITRATAPYEDQGSLSGPSSQGAGYGAWLEEISVS